MAAVVARTALTSGSASTEDLSPPDEVDSLVFTLSSRSARSGPRGGDSEPLPAVAPPSGLDSVSATTLSVPAMCWILLVNSAMYASWRHCLAFHGSVDRRPAVVSGLWSVYSVSRLPSSINRKSQIAWKQASNSLLKAEYLTCVLSSFVEKKPERLPRVRRPPPLLKGAADVFGGGIHH